MSISLIVADHRSLLQLGRAGELDSLILPDTRLFIPDVVRHELILQIAEAGAMEVLDWLRENDPHIDLKGTAEFEEYIVLKPLAGSARQRQRHEELAAAEVLGRELTKPVDAIILLFDDLDNTTHTSFLRNLPEHVVLVSASAYLKSLQSYQAGSLNGIFERIFALGRPQHD
jgi:hypothetical protein